MSNPPSISLAPGAPQAFIVIVTANAVSVVDGTNPGSVDTTTPLNFEGVQGFGPAAPIGVIASVDPTNNRRVIVTSGALQPGSPDQPWSFRVKAAGRTAFVTASGHTSAPADVSGVGWDGGTVGPA